MPEDKNDARTRRFESYLEEDRKCFEQRLASEAAHAVEKAEKMRFERLGAEIQLETEKVNLELYRLRLSRFKSEVNFAKQHQETLETISGQIEELVTEVTKISATVAIGVTGKIAELVPDKAEAERLVEKLFEMLQPQATNERSQR